MQENKKQYLSEKSSDQQSFQVLSLGEEKHESINYQPLQLQMKKDYLLKNKLKLYDVKNDLICSNLEQINQNNQLCNDHRNVQEAIKFLLIENQSLKIQLNQEILGRKILQVQLKNQQRNYATIQKQYQESVKLASNLQKKLSLLEEQLKKIEGIQKKGNKQKTQNELQNQIQGLKVKIQYFTNEQIQIKQKIEQILNIKLKKDKSKLATIIQSVIIDMNCNLKEISKQLDSLIVITSNCQPTKTQIQNKPRNQINSQTYNHWAQMSKLQKLKRYLQNYQNK